MTSGIGAMTHSAPLTETVPGLGRFFLRFWPIVRLESKLIAGGLAALLAQTVFRLLEPWPLKFVVDAIVEPNSGPKAWLPAVGPLDSDSVVLVAAVSLVAITMLRSTLGYRSKVSFAIAGNRTLTRIRSDLFRRLQILSLDFHGRERSGDLVARLVGDVGMLKDVTVNAVMPLVASLLVLIGMVAIMTWVNVELTLIVLALMPLLWLSTARRGRAITRVARKNRKRGGRHCGDGGRITDGDQDRSVSVGPRALRAALLRTQ